MNDGELVENICWDGNVLAYIIRNEKRIDKTTFITPPELKQQVGFIVYPKGSEIQRHVHRNLERHITGTSEVLVIRQGACDIEIFNDNRELVTTRKLSLGDILIMVGGGHGFRILEDTIFLEIKQGPYLGIDEKDRF
jgi:uncharacterized protein with PhoU and TrkA domain